LKESEPLQKDSLMKTNLPLVSVVIPAFNAARYVASAIESVVQQTYKNIEIIVVDDGSTDSTEIELKKFGNKIRVEKKKNGGHGSARNHGMRLAKGEFIAWLDNDDLCFPERIEVQAAYLSANQNVAIVSTDFVGFNDDGEINESFAVSYYSRLRTANGIKGVFSEHEVFNGNMVDWMDKPFDREYPVYWGNIWEELIWGNFIHPPTVMLRKSAFEMVGFLAEKFQTSSDWEYFIRFAKQLNFGYIDAPLLKYRCHENQLSGAKHYKKQSLDDLNVIQETLENNPEIKTKFKEKLEHRLSRSYLFVASAFAESDKLCAASYLIKSIKMKPFNKRNILVCLELLLPAFIKNPLRKLKRLIGLNRTD
jgi:glycosyltransferase involved in cell wall biosynthesis